jgi:hypothetical protein
MLKKRKAPEVEAGPRDTFFICDSNIDLEQSNVYDWSLTANPDCLRPIEGKQLTRIRYRPLTELEIGQLPPNDGRYQNFLARIFEACRYGLVSIDGIKLSKTRAEMGLYALTTAQLNDLCEFTGDIYFSDLIDKYVDCWSSLILNKENRSEQEEDRSEEKKESTTQDTSLPLWLGVHILLATFRSRRVNI